MLLQYDILVQGMHGVCLVCLSVQSLQEHCGLILILGSFLLCLYQQSIISNKVIFCTMKTIMCVKYLIDLVKTGTCTKYMLANCMTQQNMEKCQRSNMP